MYVSIVSAKYKSYQLTFLFYILSWFMVACLGSCGASLSVWLWRAGERSSVRRHGGSYEERQKFLSTHKTITKNTLLAPQRIETENYW